MCLLSALFNGTCLSVSVLTLVVTLVAISITVVLRPVRREPAVRWRHHLYRKSSKMARVSITPRRRRLRRASATRAAAAAAAAVCPLNVHRRPAAANCARVPPPPTAN